MLPREAFWADGSQSPGGIHEPQPINARLIPGYNPPRPFLLAPSPVPVVAAVGPAASAAPLVWGPVAPWRPWLPPVAFTEDVSLRGCVRTPRRRPAHFRLATGEGGLGRAARSGPRRLRPSSRGGAGAWGRVWGRCVGVHSPEGAGGPRGGGPAAPRLPGFVRDLAGRAESRAPGAAFPPLPSAVDGASGWRAALETCRTRPLTLLLCEFQIVGLGPFPGSLEP